MKYLLLAVIIFSFTQMLHAEEKWNLVKDKKGIKVYTRKVEGTNIKEFKVLVTFNTNLSALIATILDVNNTANWLANGKECKLLEQTTESEWVAYVLLGAPWPFRDRDMIIYHKITQDPITKVVQVKMTSELKYLPLYKKTVRMKIANGLYTLTPKGNQVEVDYSFLADPGGNIPAWVANLFMVDGPLKTIDNLKEIVETDEMKNKIIPFIQN